MHKRNKKVEEFYELLPSDPMLDNDEYYVKICNPNTGSEEQNVRDIDGIINYVAEYAEYLDKEAAVQKAQEVLKNYKEANE